MAPRKRNWREFSKAREHIRALQFASQKEYETWSKSGQRPDDIPGSPAKAYAAEWEGWADFLGNGGGRPRRLCTQGTYRPYAEAKEYVRRLGLESQKQYIEWAKTGDRPSDIPAGPYNIYRPEWTDWADWLGLRGAAGYRPFEQARAYARAGHFKTRQEWHAHTSAPEFPKDLPIYPEYAYRAYGWVDWPDWLGVEGKLTRPRILSILESLKELVPDLRPAELYAILNHKGVIKVDSRHTRINALRALERLCHTENIDEAFDEAARALEKPHLTAGDPVTSALDTGETAECDESERELTSEEIQQATSIPRLRSLNSLRVVDRAAESGLIDDHDLLEFLVSSRVAALWQEVFDGNPDFSADALRAEASGQYFDVIRDEFLAQYDGAVSLPLPPGYAFQKHGQSALPNLMQKLTAFRLQKDKRLINASGVGAGKLLAGINASQVVGAKLIVFVAINATLPNVDETIKLAFPHAKRILKERSPFSVDPNELTFIILNFESFQQEAWSDEMVSGLLAHQIDMIIVDEIQLVRLRNGAEESNRRRRLRLLIEGVAAHNPELYVLGMSATPVMNDLHEAKTLLELVTGQNLDHLPTRPTVPNAITFHQLLTRHGLRHRPNYPQAIETSCPVIDGHGMLQRLTALRPRDVLGMEQALLPAKLPVIRDALRRGTLIFTPYVTGILEPLAEAVAQANLKAGFFTGSEKSGYEQFLAGEVDVLIGSEPIGTGVDKLQEVGNRLIFVSLPWTSAQYDQVVGRLHRQGTRFDKVEVVIPQVELRRGESVWSWDRQRMDRIQFKRTLSDAVVDGTIPEGKLPTPEEMQANSLQALQKWIDSVSSGGAVSS